MSTVGTATVAIIESELSVSPAPHSMSSRATGCARCAAWAPSAMTQSYAFMRFCYEPRGTRSLADGPHCRTFGAATSTMSPIRRPTMR